MVTNVTSLGRSGLYDWLLQRISAVVIAVYFLTIMGFLLGHSELDYVTWKNFMSSLPMRILSLLMLVALVAHAWVGLWTIATDYLKPLILRLTFQLICLVTNLAYFIWAIDILWGVR